MKSLSLPSINKNQLLYWFKTISITGLAQVIVQGVGFATGILIIRLLPTQEYALYTLANTMLGTMTVLSDGGISAGVMSQGGKVWQDKEKLGAVLATGLDLRRKFAIFSLIVSLPILLYLLLHNGATWLKAILISLSLIPAFYAALSDSLLEIVPKLHQSILPLQKNQVVVSLGRLILSGITLFIFPWSYIAIIAAGLPRIWGNIKLKHISANYANFKIKSDPVIRKEIISVVKRILPGSIYYSLSGQINVWLISIFGKTTAIAQIGALTRLAVILSVFSSLFVTLVVPRFARLIENRKILRFTTLKIITTTLMILFFFIFISKTWPNEILMILGKSYTNLRVELLVMIISSCLSIFAGLVYALYTSRGWMINPIIYIPINIIALIVSIICFDISSIIGNLLVAVTASVVQVFMNIIFLYYKINRLHD